MCRPGSPGRLGRMTNPQRAQKSLARPGRYVERSDGRRDGRSVGRDVGRFDDRPVGRPVGRSVKAGMALAVVSGLAWTSGMVWTIGGWVL
ncbi:hypothetical protein J7I94_36130 [Streptomyces sp. ISL-12]|nr:hypothetical protein [Streptomyces sp. ISL-12]